MKLGLVFGGRSVEHEISIRSANQVSEALKKLNIEIIYIYIDKSGSFYEIQKPNHLFLKDCLEQKKPLQLNLTTLEPFQSIDIFFPLVHGTSGEDGCLQGFFELIGKPYIGPGVQSSSICMDKEMTKRILRAKGFNVGTYHVLKQGDEIDHELIEKEINFPCFVKPASLGSSVGISKVYSALELEDKVHLAFEHDQKVLIEKAIQGKEIECAIVGTKKPQCAFPIRLIINHDFYSYEAKYIDPNGANIEAPFQADEDLILMIQNTAIEIYKELGCESFSRIDFFLTDENELVFNEVNTIPGFTEISAFPLAWKISGVEMADLLDILITESLLRFASKKTLIQQSQVQHG